MRNPVTRPAVPRLAHRSSFEMVLTMAARVAVVAIAVVAAVWLLREAKVILAPVTLGVVLGLMFVPIVARIERVGVPPALAALVAVVMLLATLTAGAWLFAAPVSEWVSRVPAIWESLRAELANLQRPLEAIAGVQDQLRELVGGTAAMEVAVQDGAAITGIALTAPAILAQAIMVLAAFYFFLATRERIRVSILSLCVTRRMRWRTAHLFRDVEHKVSRYMLSITVLNVVEGLAVWAAFLLMGVPSAALWGAMAAVLNYLVYIGPAIMTVILLIVGFGTAPTFEAALMPAAVYLVINFIEGQFLSPHVVGRFMTINPFTVFLSLVFFLWVWGPIGGFVAVPAFLIAASVLQHVLPSRPVPEPSPVGYRRLAAAREAAARAAAPAAAATPERS